MKLAGRTLSGMSLVRPLGKGGAGEVWLAYEPEEDRKYALKILMREDDQSLLRAFVREGRSSIRLRHPNIVRVLRSAQERVGDVNMRFIIMEYLDGGSALDLLKRRSKEPLDQKLLARIALACASALEYASLRGIVHCDVKPSNILLSADLETIKLADFGLARIKMSKAIEKRLSGTADYIAPEVVAGAAPNLASDLYALGLSLYHFATGRRPVTGSDEPSVLNAQVEKPIDFNEEALAELPKELSTLIKELAEKNPADRPEVRAVTSRLRLLLGISESKESRIKVADRVGLRVASSDYVGDPTSFERLENLLSHPEYRVVTVVGPAGVGKTRFVEEYSRGLSNSLEATPWFNCDLTPASDRSEAMVEISTSIQLSIGYGDPFQQISEKLNSIGTCMLALDNLEHLKDPLATLIHELTVASPLLRILGTSRNPLGVEKELILELAGLEHQKGAASPAFRLFRNRTLQRGVDLSNPEIQKKALSLLVHLEGLPLAIELAAASFSPEEVEYNSRPHNQASSLDNVIQTSWDLLSEQDQSTLLQLSILPGGATLKVAEAVVSYPSSIQESTEVFDSLERLLERNLIQISEGYTAAELYRYKPYVSVRDYCQRALDSNLDLAHSVEDRLLQFYSEAWNDSYEKYSEAEFKSVVMEVQRETSNIVASLRGAMYRHPVVAARLLRDIWHFWLSYCNYEGRWDFASSCSDALETLNTSSLTEDEILVAISFTYYCLSHVSYGSDHEELRRYHQRLIEFAECANEKHSHYPEIQFWAFQSSALILQHKGQVDEACERFEEAFAKLDRARPDHLPLMATNRSELALTNTDHADFVRAIHYQRQAISLAKQMGTKRVLLPNKLAQLARLHAALGHTEEASDTLNELFPWVRENSDPLFRAKFDLASAAVACQQGDRKRCYLHALSSIRAVEEINLIGFQQGYSVEYARHARAFGDFQLARSILLTVTLDDKVEVHVHSCVNARYELACIHAALGEYEAAEEMLRLSRDMPFSDSRVWFTLGIALSESYLLWAKGNLESALATSKEVMERARKSKAHAFYIRALLRVALLNELIPSPLGDQEEFLKVLKAAMDDRDSARYFGLSLALAKVVLANHVDDRSASGTLLKEAEAAVTGLDVPTQSADSRINAYWTLRERALQKLES